MLEKSRLLIIDPSPSSRMKIKAVASAFMRVETLMQSLNTREALDCISGNDPFDIVFLASSFDTHLITSFVAEAKTTTKGRKAAYILIVRVKEQESAYIVNNIMLGVDGFVLEPLSVDTFMEVVKAARLKVRDGPTELDDGQKRTLLRFLITDAAQHINISAARISVGQSPGYALRDLKDTAAKLQTLVEDLDDYGSVLAEVFGNVPKPVAIKNKIKRPAKEELIIQNSPENRGGGGYFIRKR